MVPSQGRPTCASPDPSSPRSGCLPSACLCHRESAAWACPGVPPPAAAATVEEPGEGHMHVCACGRVCACVHECVCSVHRWQGERLTSWPSSPGGPGVAGRAS